MILAIIILNLDKLFASIITTAGIAGLAVGLALQGTLSNTISGIILSVRSFINIGDWIESNGFTGEVQEINLRNTVIKAPDNNIVIIPNKDVIENPMKNFSTTAMSKLEIFCGIAYDSNLEQAEDLVIRTSANVFDTAEEDIEFFYTEFGDSSINFLARVWFKSKTVKEILEGKSAAIKRIKFVFDREGIEIPFPIRTLHVPQEVPLSTNH